MGFLDEYGKKMNPEWVKVDALDNFLQQYITRHDTENRRYYNAIALEKDRGKHLEQITQRITRLEAKGKRAEKAALKDVHLKRRERKQIRENEKRKQLYKRQEQRSFLGSSVAQVIISLDGSPTTFTPGSSRRSSTVSTHEKPETVHWDNEKWVQRSSNQDEALRVTLNLRYTIPCVCWLPRYELRLNTPSSSAYLTYRAEFRNLTSETWRNTRVTLSNSQASYTGMFEKIPFLEPWHVKLAASHQDGKDGAPPWDNLLRSSQECRRLPASLAIQRQQAAQQQMQMQLNQAQQFSGTRSTAPQPASQRHSYLAGMSSAAQALPSSNPKNVSSQELTAHDPVSGSGFYTGTNGEQNDDNDNGGEFTIPPLANLQHQDSVHQQYGLTTAYDLPGRRTLVPSKVHRRHTLAVLNLGACVLRYVIVPKERTAAFLRARFQNKASMNILRGPVGMTVDGTFVGTGSLPDCSPNEHFTLSLGIDPSIQVMYAKPSVHRATAGFFAKEHAALFKRRCLVKNTKSIMAAITVVEQVPLSEDEKLKIQVLEPKGLVKEGDKASMHMKAGKGQGMAILGKSGNVKWEMQLEAGKEVQIVLEYEVKVPAGNDVVMGMN